MNSSVFRPKLLDTLKGYNRQNFTRDLLAGIIVGIVALPLAIAFGIASGVTPEKGLFTAVIAGFIISALGGSRVQIGGPTGAFIVIVYGIVQQYGVSGLTIATFMAGIMLIIMGLARMGTIIRFIPYPLIVGFTSGIALVIFSSQVKDLLGLPMGAVPADFTEKWKSYFQHFHSVSLYALAIAASTVFIIILWPRTHTRIPGSLVAIFLITAIASIFQLPVETIGSRFGDIRAQFPSPRVPSLSFTVIQNLIQPAFTIALLGGIESLLSAIVADGMTGGHHRSNMELVAQGTANVFSSLFGGIPATGAIARTATNVKNGGGSPVAGMIHAITLFLIVVFAGKWASLIPMAALGGILVVVAYNMSEWKNFRSILAGPKSDVAVLLTTFILTVLVDLTVAIEIGMLLAVFLFMRKMIRSSDVSQWKNEEEEDEKIIVPGGAALFEINGPLFFGAAYKFKDAIRPLTQHPAVLIIRMRKVPIIDATGIRTIEDVYKQSKQWNGQLILCEIHSEQVMEELKRSGLLFTIGQANITGSIESAIERCNALLKGDRGQAILLETA